MASGEFRRERPRKTSVLSCAPRTSEVARPAWPDEIVRRSGGMSTITLPLLPACRATIAPGPIFPARPMAKLLNAERRTSLIRPRYPAMVTNLTREMFIPVSGPDLSRSDRYPQTHQSPWSGLWSAPAVSSARAQPVSRDLLHSEAAFVHLLPGRCSLFSGQKTPAQLLLYLRNIGALSASSACVRLTQKSG